MNQSRIWWLGFALVAIAVIALGWFVGVSPRLDEAAAANLSAQDVASQNALQEQQLTLLQQQSEDLPQLEDDLAELQRSVPPMPRVAEFVDAVNAAARAENIEVTSLTASQPEAFTPATPESDAAPSGFYVINVSIAAEGDGGDLATFSTRVRESDRLMLVSDYTYTRELDSADGQLTLSGYIYVLEDPRVTVVNESVVLPDGTTPVEEAPAESETEEGAEG